VASTTRKRLATDQRISAAIMRAPVGGAVAGMRIRCGGLALDRGDDVLVALLAEAEAHRRRPSGRARCRAGELKGIGHGRPLQRRHGLVVQRDLGAVDLRSRGRASSAPPQR
jgi:hypothetical protein